MYQLDTLTLPLGPLMIDVESLTLTENDKKRLSNPLVGSVILFSRNFQDKQQLSQLCKAIKTLRSPELLIAVDHEGGRVQRFKEDFFRLPSLYSFADIFDKDPSKGEALLRQHALVMFQEIQAVGIDFSFTPVVDLMMPESHIIGDRAFHSDAKQLSKMAGIYIDALNSLGTIATAKHFPGHGGIVEDSHVTLPVDKRELKTLIEQDMLPYAYLSPLGLDAVMTAHVQFPNIDKDLPTFSSYWLNDILRDLLGFTGVVFSDDLAMEGAVISAQEKAAKAESKQNGNDNNSLFSRVDSALSNGCDIAIICNRLEEVDAFLAHPQAKIIEERYYRGGERLNTQLLRRRSNAKRVNPADYLSAKQQLTDMIA